MVYVDGDESAGDGDAADDTSTTSFHTVNGIPMLVFQVFSTVSELMSLLRGSFSKSCPPDLGKSQDVP